MAPGTVMLCGLVGPSAVTSAARSRSIVSALGRPAGAVEGDDAARARGQEDEAVAADAGHLRLDHAERGDGGHGGVDGAGTGAQEVEGRQGRQRVRGRRHALAAIGRGPAGLVERAHLFPPPAQARWYGWPARIVVAR